MIAMSFRTFIIKVLVFILSPPFLKKIGGRHPTTNVSEISVSHNNYLIQEL